MSGARPAQIGSPWLGRGAGFSAASIEARPGLAIGVGGSPSWRYVLYGVSIAFRSANEAFGSWP